MQGIDAGTSEGIGVLGTSADGFGLIGVNGPSETNLPTYVAGVAGISETNTGVFGQSTTGTSIYGVSAQKSGLEAGSVAGVWGDSKASIGVQGTSATDIGVLGVSYTGIGVKAVSASGSALDVMGVATFARSGVITIAAGASSATHTGVTLSSASLVLANLQNSLPGVFVEAVVPSISGHSFEIFLSTKVPAGKTAKVAWFVVN